MEAELIKAVAFWRTREIKRHCFPWLRRKHPW